MNFDINDHLIEGVSAKIVFKTGVLAGSEFEISSYDGNTKEITFIRNVDQFDYELPNDIRKPSIGDSYTLIGINMPEIYVTEAESLLKQKTIEHAENNRLAVIYDLDIDKRYIRRNNILIDVGIRVTVKSENLNIDELIEVNQVVKSLIEPEDIKVVLSNTTIIAEADRNLQLIKEAPRRINEAERAAIELSRIEALRTNRFRSTMVYKGFFNTESKYINNNHRTDVVKYEDKFWFYQGVNDTANQWDEKNWSEFEGNFETIGTDLLLAEQASIADWTIRNGKITSQTEQEGIPNMVLNGGDGIIRMSGLSLEGFRQKSELRDEGSFLESAGMPLEEYTGLLGQRIISSNSSVVRNSIQNISGEFPNRFQNVLAAYYGKAINTNDVQKSQSYGGYFDEFRADGMSLGVASNNGSVDFTIGENDSKIESLYEISSFSDVDINVGFASINRIPNGTGGGSTISLANRGKFVIIQNIHTRVVNIGGDNIFNSDGFVLQPFESAFFVQNSFGWMRIGGLNESEVENGLPNKFGINF